MVAPIVGLNLARVAPSAIMQLVPFAYVSLTLLDRGMPLSAYLILRRWADRLVLLPFDALWTDLALVVTFVRFGMCTVSLWSGGCFAGCPFDRAESFVDKIKCCLASPV